MDKHDQYIQEPEDRPPASEVAKKKKKKQGRLKKDETTDITYTSITDITVEDEIGQLDDLPDNFP